MDIGVGSVDAAEGIRNELPRRHLPPPEQLTSFTNG
jgi:hypothetical protein